MSTTVLQVVAIGPNACAAQHDLANLGRFGLRVHRERHFDLVPVHTEFTQRQEHNAISAADVDGHERRIAGRSEPVSSEQTQNRAPWSAPLDAGFT